MRFGRVFEPELIGVFGRAAGGAGPTAGPE
jgi:hypothetical protein